MTENTHTERTEFSPEIQEWQTEARAFYNRLGRSFDPEALAVRGAMNPPRILWGTTYFGDKTPREEWADYLATLDAAIAVMTEWRATADTLTERIEGGIVEREADEQNDIWRTAEAEREAEARKVSRERKGAGVILKKAKGRSLWKVLTRTDDDGAVLESVGTKNRRVIVVSYRELCWDYEVSATDEEAAA